MREKLILHIPHAGTDIPDKTGYVVSDDYLKSEILLLTDWYTDDLFSVTNSISIVADFNRVFCDVERFSDDDKEVMSNVGMGFAYTRCDDGSDLRKVSEEFKAKILNEYYYPHHKKLKNAVTERLTVANKALIVDCHSFSNNPFKRDLNQLQPRPDICIGIDSFHTPRVVYEFSLAYFNLHGYLSIINSPYSGSIVPMEYYQKDNRVYSIMIEINRNLYLVPGTNIKSEGYDKIKLIIRHYLIGLNELSL